MKQIVLRAYQLARSGKCANVEEIQTRLLAEGFHRVSVEEDIARPTVLRADLAKLCDEAKGKQWR